MTVCSSLSELPAGNATLQITTFNMLAPLWVHESFYPGIDAQLLDATTRRSILVERLAELQSDVVLLQEVQKDYLEQLLYLVSLQACHLVCMPMLNLQHSPITQRDSFEIDDLCFTCHWQFVAVRVSCYEAVIRGLGAMEEGSRDILSCEPRHWRNTSSALAHTT